MAGKITSIAGGAMDYKAAKQIRIESTDASMELDSARDTVLNAKGKVNYAKYKAGQKGTANIVKGYWTDGADKPITEAIVGDYVKFHIETRGIPNGALIWFGLYDDDRLVNPAEDGEDDQFKMEHYDTHKGYFTEPVKDGKAVIKITLNHLETAVHAEEDRMLELYYRISYRSQNIDLPLDKNDYLKLIALPLVIDRYKMPGLNMSGDEIADDMAFGYGIKRIGSIYGDELDNYKRSYAANGWDITKHYVLANLDESPKSLFNAKQLDEVVVKSNHLPAAVADKTRISPPILVPTAEERAKQIADAAKSQSRKARYSREEIISHRRWLMELSAEASEWSLRADLRLMKTAMVWGELSPVLDAMIDKFCTKKGGIFENTKLTDSIKNNPATHQYCTLVEDFIAQHLKEKNGSLIGIEQLAPDFVNGSKRNAKKKFKTPAFVYSKDGNLIAGRTLALNDIWATEVILKYIKKHGENYDITYQITLWDHFGIDAPDMDKFFSYGAGFRAWFVLQHLHGYKPFLTKMVFERTFSGNLAIGGDDRANARQEAARQKALQDRQDERLRQLTRRRPGEY